jgi:predicted phosphodiesterase
MRYALLSDIHANLPALRAVLGDIDKGGSGVDAIYHLGDLTGYAPWPNETVALLRERGIPGIAGNYDSTVATTTSTAVAKRRMHTTRSCRTSRMNGLARM